MQAKSEDKRQTTVAAGIKKQELLDTQQWLQQLPPKEKEVFLVKDAIQALQAELLMLLSERGYSYDDLAALLQQRQIKIKASTLKQYLAEFKRKSAQPATKNPRTKPSRAAGATR